MRASGRGESFAVDLIRLREGLEYRVEADTLRSQIFTLNVLPRPRVSEVSITYRYPSLPGRNAHSNRFR